MRLDRPRASFREDLPDNLTFTETGVRESLRFNETVPLRRRPALNGGYADARFFF